MTESASRTPGQRAPERRAPSYEQLSELVGDALVVTDAQGMIQEANGRAEAMLRGRRGTLAGTPLARYVSDLGPVLDEVVHRRRVTDVRLRVRPPGAPAFQVSVRGAVSHGDRDGDFGIWWILRERSEDSRPDTAVRRAADLEERVERRTRQLQALAGAQEDVLRELIAERSRLEAVLEHMPGGVVLADAPSGEVVLANREAGRLLGIELVGARAADLKGCQVRQPDGTPYKPEEWPLAQSLVRGETIRGERLDIVRSDGSRVMLETNSAPVYDREGQIVAAVATFYDIGDRERRARAEGDFITNAAHQLRTPLAAIASAIEVLQGGAKEREGPRDRFLAHIDEQCARLQRLVRALLVLARAQIGTEAPLVEPVELAPLFDQVARGLSPREGVSVAVGCTEGLVVSGNRELLEEAVANIAGNAAKYAESGKIVLSARRGADGWVTVEVADEGPGMQPDVRERALERFYRGRDGDADGFGLGMAIAAQAVEAMGGRIELESNHGTGTAVRMTLPSAPAE